MRSEILLLWIFAGASMTLVLQPSVTVSVLQNGSVDVGLWAGWSQPKLPSAVQEKEQKLTEDPGTEEEDTGPPYSKSMEEEEHENFKEEERKVDIEEQSNQENVSNTGEQEERTRNTDAKKEEESGHKENGQRTMHPSDDPAKEHEYPSETSTVHQNLNPANTPVASSSQYVDPTLHPIVSTVMQRPPVTQISSEMKERPTSLLVAQFSHFLVTNASTLLTSGTSSTINSSVAQTEKGSSSSHPATKFAPPAEPAKAGPTAINRPKPQAGILEANIKQKRIAKMKTNGVKEKKTKPSKKERRVKTLEKDETTTAPYFPYFKDHYCPPDCACYGRVVQCADKALDKIPYGIPYNSRYILLMNNHIENIPLDLLSEYFSVEFLVLSNNHLKDSSIDGAFEGIQALKRLYLEQNLLQSIPTDLPLTLEELRLDGNKVSVMTERPWSRCPGLLILSLSNNTLGGGSSTIPAGVLSPLVSLRTLSLSYNQLSAVPLHLPISLQELYLRGNSIQRFKGGTFQGKADLQVLDLSSNRLTNKGLGKAAFLNTTRLESLNLEGNFLKHVPRHLPRSLKTLNLEGNSISSVSKNAFLSLPHLEHLGLARNKISKVAPGAFWMLPLLHQLDLSHNALRQVPRQLPTWLVSIALTYNKIQTIPYDAFCWTRNGKTPSSWLVRVHLENNLVDLGSLDSHAFSCLRGFQVVHF